MSDHFWSSIHTAVFANEADVETRLVLPLLLALGYAAGDIKAKQPILFREGRVSRRGRKPEADFVVYGSLPHGRATSLMVVEAKHPDEPLGDALEQGDSYAQNLRVPLVLVTNGHTIEVWQSHVAGDTRRVFDCQLDSLSANRGALESLASKRAAKFLCETIEYKRFDTLAADTTAFDERELTYFRPVAQGKLPRSLKTSGKSETTRSSDVLIRFPGGAIVTGSSGFGKTSLAATLVCEAIESRWEGRHSRLVFELFLPNVRPDDGGIEVFLQGRVSSVLPQFTSDYLRDRLRLDGASIFADGFERTAPEYRAAISRILRVFMRDYPKCQLYVFSRPHAIPQDLNLPVIELGELTKQDVVALMVSEGVPSGSYMGGGGLPDYMLDLCKHPLLAALVIAHRKAKGSYPRQIRPLYEEWLTRVLEPFDAVKRAAYREVLRGLAQLTRTGPIAIGAAAELTKTVGDAWAVLSALADADAISIRDTTVELAHEGLADYLRALMLLERPLDEALEQLELMELDASSQFPRLLVSCASDVKTSRAIWDKIAEKDLTAALDTARFTHGGPVSQTPSLTADSEVYFTDLLLGFDAIAGRYFPGLLDAIKHSLVRVKTDILGVAGRVQGGYAGYHFFDAPSVSERIAVGTFERGHQEFGRSLEKMGFGPEAGKVFGIGHLVGALGEVLKMRTIHGGRIWSEELVYGRLKHIERKYRLGLSAPYDLVAARNVIVNNLREYVSPFDGQSGQTFRISGLVADIDFLISEGVTSLSTQWIDIRSVDLDCAADQIKVAGQLDEFYRRQQSAYSEIIERNCRQIDAVLPQYPKVPSRYELEIALSEHRKSNLLSMNYRKWPVAKLSEAGADVSFVEELSDPMSIEASDEYFRSARQRLQRMGKGAADYNFSHGWTGAPDIGGGLISRNGVIDETAIISTVIGDFKEDLRSLFNGLPGLDHL